MASLALTADAGIALGLHTLPEDLLGDGLVAHQLAAALEVRLRVFQIGLGRFQIGARLVERVLERPLVDGEKQVALLDDLAVREMHRVEIAGHTGAHLDRIDGDEAADILVLVDDGALDRRRDRHHGRSLGGRGPVGWPPQPDSDEGQQEQQGSQSGAMRSSGCILEGGSLRLPNIG